MQAKQKRIKQRRINRKIPKDLRSNDKRSNIIKNVPLSELDDLSILNFFKNNSSLIRRFIVKEKLSYEESLRRIEGALYYVDEKDFADYVRLCLKACKDLDHPGERLLSYIITYIQERYRDFKFHSTDLVYESINISYLELMPPLFFHQHEKFYYDFAEDYFLNGLSYNSLKEKYGFDTPMLKKALEYLFQNEIMPQSMDSWYPQVCLS